jgi:hypothetical protein
MAGNHRFCARCQYKHASPTGKKCRCPILEPVADPAPERAVGGDLPEQPEMLDLAELPEVAVGNNNDISNDTLLSVVSDLASRVDATQRRIDALHLTASPLTQSADTGVVAPLPSSERFLNAQLEPLDTVVLLQQVCTVTCHTYRT